jgi:protein-disulfide isomerase
MADPPRERRRKAKPVTDEDDEVEAIDARPSAQSKKPRAGGPLEAARANPLWPLLAGLAIGFAVGREAYHLSPDARPSASVTEDAAKAAADVAKGSGYAKETDFPAAWVKTADLGTANGVFAGLSDAQKVTVMQALNERDCECGCGMGSLATCLKQDPNCPRSPAMAKLAVELVKQGKSAKDIEAAIDAKQKEMGGPPKPAAAAEEPEPPSTPKRVELSPWNPRKGPKAAKVTIVEFSDFQCPFCARAVPVLKQIDETYGKDVAVVFKNQPLPFHDKAKGAAYAFLAASLQGKAWPMHDKMFGNNTALTRSDLDKYAQEIGLDLARFDKDMDDPKVHDEVDADSKQGDALGANGTPTFFINGRELVGAQPFEKFKEVIDEEIKKADELVKAGTPLGDVYKKRTEP